MKMKKKVALIVLLIAVVSVGSVYAKPGDLVWFTLKDTDLNKMGMGMGTDAKFVDGSKAKITVNWVKQSLVGIDVNYSCANAPGNVLFKFTAYFSAGRKPVTWTNTEKITSPRNSSTFKFTLANYLYLDNVVIEYYIY
jgi:hypothetical protein